MNPTEPQVLLSKPVAQALLDYLAQRPYREVATLIDAISKAPLANVVQEQKGE